MNVMMIVVVIVALGQLRDVAIAVVLGRRKLNDRIGDRIGRRIYGRCMSCSVSAFDPSPMKEIGAFGICGEIGKVIGPILGPVLQARGESRLHCLFPVTKPISSVYG